MRVRQTPQLFAGALEGEQEVPCRGRVLSTHREPAERILRVPQLDREADTTYSERVDQATQPGQ